MDATGLILVGIRHHSPACARRVRRAIDDARPAFVLIEGPSDFNPHIGDLSAEHGLPLAIFSYCSDRRGSRASYTPFCDYSPEWQALRTAWSTGATPLFCDLPAWDPAFGERENRYADPHRLLDRYRTVTASLAARLGAEGQDAMWDALAEQAGDDALPAILERYFTLLRPEDAEDPSEAARERFMAAYAAWALKEAGGRQVVLVCGGWHVGGIRAALPGADGTMPLADEPETGHYKGSYLLPYSYQRLDRFTGYSAGMPSPGYYHQLHQGGPDQAAHWAMTRITDALRRAGQVVSTADRIAWHLHAEALARLRGHPAMLRADILDAALAALVKDGLERPPAWTEAGAVSQGNDPFVIAMLRALSGDEEGRLAPGTRQPPLIADVEARLAGAGLTPERTPRRVDIDWHKDGDLERANILHQLRILCIPGIVRREGPTRPDARDMREVFEISYHRDQAAALIEASRWGGTLPMAASSSLSDQVQSDAGDLVVLARVLADTLFAGLSGSDESLVAALAAAIPESHAIGALGRAGRQLAALYRFGAIFGTAAHADLGILCTTLFERAVWLIEGVGNDDDAARSIDIVLACRDLARDCPELTLDRAGASAMLARLVADRDTPATLAGAGLGYLVACGEERAEAPVIAGRMRGFGLPDHLGDFLAGLFALAREELGSRPDILAIVDDLVASWSEADYLTALPAMRMAFAWFPPGEREALARIILQQRGFSAANAGIEALAWMRQRTAVVDQAAALSLEAQVRQRLACHGLD